MNNLKFDSKTKAIVFISIGIAFLIQPVLYPIFFGESLNTLLTYVDILVAYIFGTIGAFAYRKYRNEKK